MPVTTYECLVIFDTSKASGNSDSQRDALMTLLERHHCDVIAHRVWDERRLAYPIGNQKKGNYYLVYFSTETKNLMPLEQDFRIAESVLRHLTLAIHPKWVEPMLEVAREERATCLKLMGDDLEDSSSRHIPRSGPAAVAHDEQGDESPVGVGEEE